MSLREDFARWRDDPVTLLVFKGLTRAAQAQKEQWDQAGWGGQVIRGPDLERLLQELRVRADAYSALSEMTLDDLVAWLDLELKDE